MSVVLSAKRRRERDSRMVSIREGSRRLVETGCDLAGRQHASWELGLSWLVLEVLNDKGMGRRRRGCCDGSIEHLRLGANGESTRLRCVFSWSLQHLLVNPYNDLKDVEI
jgi:hypothetical protein